MWATQATRTMVRLSMVMVIMMVKGVVEAQAIELSYPGLITVFHLGKEVVSGIIDAWDLLENVDNMTLPFQKNRDKKILQRINVLSSQISASQASMSDDFRQYVQNAILLSTYREKFIARFERLHQRIGALNRRERTMNAMLEASEAVEQLTLTQFALATVDLSKTDNVIDLLHGIEELVSGEHLVLPPGQQDIFYQINETENVYSLPYHHEGLSYIREPSTCNGHVIDISQDLAGLEIEG